MKYVTYTSDTRSKNYYKNLFKKLAKVTCVKFCASSRRKFFYKHARNRAVQQTYTRKNFHKQMRLASFFLWGGVEFPQRVS